MSVTEALQSNYTKPGPRRGGLSVSAHSEGAWQVVFGVMAHPRAGVAVSQGVREASVMATEDLLGDTVCDRCGVSFDLEEIKAEFDHYYGGSSGWRYDEVISSDLCRQCAETDADQRWMDGELEAADGPPPSPEEMSGVWEKLGRLFGR